MYQIDRSPLGFNLITYSPEPLDSGFDSTFTVYGKGLIDRIALLVLRILGTFFDHLEPIKFSVSYSSKDRIFLPQEMYITKLSLKTLFSKEIRKKYDIEFTKKTQNSLIKETFRDCLKDSYEINLEKALQIFDRNISSEIEMRTISLELYLSEMLSKIPLSEPCDYEFTLPVDLNTGKLLLEKEHLKSAYPIRIRIYEEDGKKRALTLEGKKGENPEFTEEASYILYHVQKRLKSFVADSSSLKEAAKKFEADAFKREYTRMGTFPIIDESKSTQVLLEQSIPYPLANHIQLEGKKYIATSYPLYSDLEEFWEMVFEQKAPIIVKLNNVKKTAQEDASYWPSPDEELEAVYDENELSVLNNGEKELAPGLVLRELEVTKNAVSHKVSHIDFTAWKDGGVPSIKEMENLIEAVKSAEKENESGPIVVHCAGGIGRTGTFLAIYSTLEKKHPNFSKVLYTMRKQRNKKMVETPEQFSFIKAFHSEMHKGDEKKRVG